VLVQSGSLQQERTRSLADHFLDEMRHEIVRCSADGIRFLPRVRCVHERQGHATPEFRTLLIPPGDGAASLTPESLSFTIAEFARRRRPDRLILVMDADRCADGGEPESVLIAEARDRMGTRLFLVQPYRSDPGSVSWHPPRIAAWDDPGDEEMILDAAFSLPAGERSRTNRGSA
jgi:hypothetical protein